MRTIRSVPVFALALVVAAAVMTPGQAQVKDHNKIRYPEMRPFQVPQPERTVLGNGMTVLLLEDHELPLIELRARIRTGARLEPADRVGLASIFGDVLRTGGTESMTGDEIDDFLEARAAIVETGVGDDSAFATVSSLTADFPDVLKLFAEILRKPVFSEDKIEISKTQEKGAIARRNDNPNGIRSREFAKLIYGAESPYARTTEYATIENITRDDLIAFHRQFVQPNRIILGVMGDFEAAKMAEQLRTTFGDWPRGPEPKDPEAAYQENVTPGVYFIPKEDMTQSNISMGHLGIERTNPDIFAVRVLNEAFGGSPAARLFSNVRSKKGLAYRVGGSVGANYDYPGTFGVSMSTKIETTAAGIDALLEEIDAIVSNPPSEEEVNNAKESILNSFVFNFDSKVKILNQQITYEYFGFPLDYLAQYRRNIEEVTTEDVARVAKKYIHKDKIAILVVGPTEGQDRPLDSFGPVSQIDITIPEPKGPEAPVATAESAAKGAGLFAKVVEGLGGVENVEKVKALQSVFDLTTKTPQGEMTFKVVSTFSLPDRVHQAMDTPMGEITVVLTDTEGFVKMPQGVSQLPESRRADMAKSIKRHHINLVQHRDDPDLELQHLGQETVDGANLEVLLVTMGEDELRLFVEPSTGHVLRQTYRGQSNTGPGEFVVSFSDFREVDGLMLPFQWRTVFNGEQSESRVFEQISVNPEVDAALFASPETASASGEES